MWGATSPTNPTAPATATATAAKATLSTSNAVRRPATDSPKPVAISSPRARAFSTRAAMSPGGTSTASHIAIVRTWSQSRP